MLKNILAPLAGFAHDANTLEAAFLAGWPFDAAIDAVHVQPDPMKIVVNAALNQFRTSHGNRELLHDFQKSAEERSAKAKEVFDAFAARRLTAHAFGSSQSGTTAAFRCIEGDPVSEITAAARYADLVVFAHASAPDEFSTDQIANVLVDCGRPVLVAPRQPSETIGRVVAIAWKDKAEAARAVTAAMPLLKAAKKVVVLSVEEQSSDASASAESAEHLAAQLRRHGMQVEAHGLSAERHAGANVLIEKAKALGADLIVSGAYSHSRMRELVFGGFTRTLLTACDLPVLLLH